MSWSGGRPSRPARRLIMVNGLPGSGKSTLGARLARAWRAPLYSKDSLKDFLAELQPQEPTPAWLSREANALIWHLVSRSDRAVIETWFGPTGIGNVRAGLATAGLAPEDVCEVWCDAPVHVARDRFLSRGTDEGRRHPRHLRDGADPQWWDGLGSEGPIALGSVVRVDTSRPISDEQVTDILAQATGVRPDRS